MLDVQYVKYLEQHAYHPFTLDIQHVIGLKQHVKIHDPLPLTRDNEDEDNPDLRLCPNYIY
jgi:hypothetical protein